MDVVCWVVFWIIARWADAHQTAELIFGVLGYGTLCIFVVACTVIRMKYLDQ